MFVKRACVCVGSSYLLGCCVVLVLLVPGTSVPSPAQRDGCERDDAAEGRQQQQETIEQLGELDGLGELGELDAAEERQ